MEPYYNSLDIQNVLYANQTLTADGNSSAITFGVPGGCGDDEIVLNMSGLANPDTVKFYLQDDSATPGTFADTPYALGNLDHTMNGVWIFPIDNRVITGTQLRIRHDVTLATGHSVVVSGHVRPRR